MTATTASTNKPLVMALNTLIETCVDGEKGYALAAADARDRTLRRRLLQLAEQRAEFVQALSDAVIRLGAMPEHEGSASGTAYRLATGVRRVTAGRDDKVLVEECLAADEVARKRYLTQIDRLSFARAPSEIRQLVDRQCAAIRATEGELAGMITTL